MGEISRDARGAVSGTWRQTTRLPAVMFKSLDEVKSLIKLDKICIDNNIFRLHYKATFVILLTASIIVTAKQYVGDPIDCIVGDGVPDNLMDTYCWIHSTFTVTSAVTEEVGGEVAHPGVAVPQDCDEQNEDGDCKYHKYYQWVCFTLYFQAILFYIPRYLWKVWEAGKLNNLIEGFCFPIIDDEKKDDEVKTLVTRFQGQRNRSRHNWYAAKFFFCECLNLVGQIYFMDLFLGGGFTTYGSEVWGMMQQDFEERTDPMARVFPKMAKCTFHKYGPSGTIQKHDGLCILPVNIINEKIYFFLWFWFISLAILTAFQQLYRLVTVVSPGLQITRMKAMARAVPEHKIRDLSKRTSVGDWFLLSQMGKNMDSLIFRDFMDQLCDEMNT